MATEPRAGSGSSDPGSAHGEGVIGPTHDAGNRGVGGSAGEETDLGPSWSALPNPWSSSSGRVGCDSRRRQGAGPVGGSPGNTWKHASRLAGNRSDSGPLRWASAW
jgi:hypothetical protein